jgi:hypothetical protein
MEISSIHKYKTFFALLLTFLLTGSMVIKPVHVLLVHHELAYSNGNDQVHKTLSKLHNQDCAICDFEFCSFIPQKQVIVPQVNIINIHELASRMVACFVSTSSHNFQLRAPPVC